MQLTFLGATGTVTHIDHGGYLPLLVKNGFRGNVYRSGATKAK